jgi:hypothetical protein
MNSLSSGWANGWRAGVAVTLCVIFPTTPLLAQDAAIGPVKPAASILFRPYEAVDVPAVRLADSDRLHALIRDGKLYLTAQDAIALALENNIDLEIARYAPISAAWRVTRAEAGGALPGVPSAASQTTSVASGQGVLGSQAAAGVQGGGSRRPRSLTLFKVSPRHWSRINGLIPAPSSRACSAAAVCRSLTATIT